MVKKNEMPSHHGVTESPSGKYPNQTLKLLLERASCRNFADRKVPAAVLDYVLEAGIHAPTGGNLQPYSIIKIEEDERRRRLAELCGSQPWIEKAPVSLLFCIDWRRLERWAKLEIAPFTATSSFRHFWISFQDTVICAQNICTAADSLGLGSVYIGTVIECFRELRDMLHLPNGVFPVVLLCLGYPEAKPEPRRKLDASVIVHHETYSEMEDENLRSSFNKKYPSLKVEATEERLQEISEVCRKTNGDEFAKRCVESIEENGYINPVQRYFGLHYRADLMPEGNENYLALMAEFGFNWFEPCRFVDDRESSMCEGVEENGCCPDS
jgi:FMN reductase [NAD(P)H]